MPQSELTDKVLLYASEASMVYLWYLKLQSEINAWLFTCLDGFSYDLWDLVGVTEILI